MNIQQRVETSLEYQLGMFSALYLHRDWLRTQYMGNYPAFWLLGKIVPQSMRDSLLSTKGAGTNRLAARMDDHPFDKSSHSKIDDSVGPSFSQHQEGDSLEQAITVARSISKREPIIVIFPMHYEYNQLTDKQNSGYILALEQLYAYITAIGQKNNCKVMIIKSKDFQQPEYWTRTPAHFNVPGSARVWESLRDGILKLYPQ